MASNLRVREVRLLDKMLDLGADSTSGFSSTQDDFSDQWKLLIYDNDCRDIISPLLNVGALRAKGVTLHMLLHSEREAVPDAPAVYFVRPTEANLARIVDDCKKQLYRAVYLNFSTRVERPLLEVVMQRAEHNQSKAAEWLGLNRNTLRKKLLEHDLLK